MQRMSNQQHPTKSSSPHRLHDFDDAELVQMLVTGNRDAMEVIFDRYYRLVMRITLNMVRDVSEAQDVCQIVFTDFYRQARLFDPARGRELRKLQEVNVSAGSN
jgi:RNA polymerase sigma-70 factor (ECF subfamily)